jgi:hypothetical protein
MEFMSQKCKGCGYYVDCSREEFEKRDGYCEDCFEDKDSED